MRCLHAASDFASITIIKSVIPLIELLYAGDAFARTSKSIRSKILNTSSN